MHTISLDDLPAIQHVGADSGKPPSGWAPRDSLRIGMLAEVHQRWAVIVYIRPKNDTLAVQLREVDGSHTVQFLADGGGMYVRLDVVVDLGDHRAPLLLPIHAGPSPRHLGVGPVPAHELTVGTEVICWTAAATSGQLATQTPCCGRRLTIAAVRGLHQFAVCCKHSRIFGCVVEQDLDGGDQATFTVLTDTVAVASHRGVSPRTQHRRDDSGAACQASPLLAVLAEPLGGN
ncbi:hypothetical protein [Kutzneria sp. 744]|uniref:hypothetical protein n=1 Tax=Kutzneria sp. (strain 744) TaxID=345341 RepID=UPI0003EEDC54|nr:hypothetical protein [Kutzneria sp. 744]EWM19685.1 hypothetical protein KUTG_09989 [Kutzneria sp. 744]